MLVGICRVRPTDSTSLLYWCVGPLLRGWIDQFGSLNGPGTEYCTAVDSNENIYIAGWADSVLSEDPLVNSYDVFLRKYDADGNEVWTRQYGSSSYDYGYGISVDASGVYVTGYTDGVLPGGGVSLLACRPAVQELLEASSDPDERAAYRILIKALEAPARAIIGNGGYDASEVMAEIRLAGPGHGFDVRHGKVVDIVQAGIYDLAGVQKAAVYGAVASAALALTVDVLIHHKKPPQATTP